jgi:glutaminyl-tRNA synthetase
MQKIIRKTIQRVLENYLPVNYIYKEEIFLKWFGSPKFFRLSIGNEVRLKKCISSKQESVVKDSEGITEIHVT